MLPRSAPIRLALFLAPAMFGVHAQNTARTLHQRDVPCPAQYTLAVQTIGMARWSAPESDRPAIERLLNAAAKAKELVDASFLQWEASLCSAETLGRLHTSVDQLRSNHWLPETPADQSEAEASAANAELLKAMDAGFDQPSTTSSNAGAPAPVQGTTSHRTAAD